MLAFPHHFNTSFQNAYFISFSKFQNKDTDESSSTNQVLETDTTLKQQPLLLSKTFNEPTRKWHSESADPAKALGPSDILDRNPVVDIHYLLFWEILLTNKQTNKQTDRQKLLATQRFELSTLAFLAQCSYRLSYRAVLIWLVLSDYYYSLYSPNLIKIRPVVHEKQLSGCQIRISIRITPNFELGLPMIITSLLTKLHQNPTSSLWEILLTNKQTNTRRWLQYPAFRGIIKGRFE